jgi:hypothetical protein
VGTVSWKGSGMLDGLGFELQTVLIDPVTRQACPANGRCEWAVVFGGWDGRYVGDVEIKGGAPRPEPDGGTTWVDDVVTVRATVLSGTTDIPVAGRIR